MASTLVKSSGGAASVTFGTGITFTALIVESQTHTKSTQNATLADADGDIVAAAFFGASEKLSVSGSVNGTPSVTLGTAITLTGAPTGTWYPESYEEAATNKGYKTFSLSCTRWPSTEA